MRPHCDMPGTIAVRGRRCYSPSTTTLSSAPHLIELVIRQHRHCAMAIAAQLVGSKCASGEAARRMPRHRHNLDRARHRRLASRPAAWISNARMIEFQPGANEPQVSGQRAYNAGARRYNPTNTNRSKGRKIDLFGSLRRSRLICSRKNSVSASSRTLELNKLVNAAHSSMRMSTIGQ
jgi:hypothetical protein